MKVTTVMKPAMLFAAGSIASVAHGAVVTNDNDGQGWTASKAGTPIYLAGARTPQYTFGIGTDPLDNTDPTLYYLIRGRINGPKLTPDGYGTAAEAQAESAFSTFAKTGTAGDVSTLASDDSFYGLRFTTSKIKYSGYAQVQADGSFIREIVYEAIGSVPEPESWALMIAGFGGLGLAMRRRRRQAAIAAVA